MSTRQQSKKKLIHALAEMCGVGTSGFVFSSPLDEDGLDEDDEAEVEELEGFAEEEDGLADEEDDDDGREDEEDEEDLEADESECMMLNGRATADEISPRKTRIRIGIGMR